MKRLLAMGAVGDSAHCSNDVLIDDPNSLWLVAGGGGSHSAEVNENINLGYSQDQCYS